MHKLAAERLCVEYGALFAVRSSIVRFTSLIGTGLRKQLLWDACGKLSLGERTFSGTGEEKRDWLSVEDAVDLIVIAAEHATGRAPVVNGGTGTATTVRDILTELAESMGVRERPVFSGDVRRGDPVRLEADVSCARSWGWEPHIHWRTAVRQYSDWFLRGAS
jgi:UDP-glucose 4-epimerase